MSFYEEARCLYHESNFIWYCEHNDYDGVVYCLNYCDATNINMESGGETGLIYACRKNNILIVKILLLYKKLNVNYKSKYYKNTAFTIACWYNRLEIVKLLLKNKQIKVNMKDKYGYTGFIIACKDGYKEIVKLLLEDSRIDIDLKDKNGKTGFMYACEKNRIEIIKLIQKYNIKNSIKNNVEFNIN